MQFTKTSKYEKREERYSTTNVLSTNNLHKLRFNVMRSTKMKALERSSRLPSALTNEKAEINV